MSSSQSDYIKYLNNVSNGISYYYLMITFPLGILGNLISLYIYTRPNLNRKTNTGFLYTWLCVFNLLSILQYVFLTRSSILFNFTINLPCGVVNFLRRTIFNWLSWMQVYISFDRFMAVYFPTKITFMSKKIVHYLAMVGILAFVLATNITNLITWPVPTVVNNTTITYSCYISNDINVLTSIIALLMRIYIPYALMAFFNGLVISRLKKSKIKVGISVTNQPSGHKGASSTQLTRKEYKFIQATLLMDLIFLLMHIPVGSWLTMSIVDQYTKSLSSIPLTNAIYSFYANIAQLLAFSYSMAGIFMFTTFNRNFRDELIDLLRLRRVFGQGVDNSRVLNNSINGVRTNLY